MSNLNPRFEQVVPNTDLMRDEWFGKVLSFRFNAPTRNVTIFGDGIDMHTQSFFDLQTAVAANMATSMTTSDVNCLD
jgi:hypothetical protein